MASENRTPFSAEERAYVAASRSTNPPVTWQQIADHLNRSLHAVRIYGARLREGAARSSSVRPPPTRRACLCCGYAFRSTGRGHRMCDACRRLSDSPYEPVIVSGGRRIGPHGGTSG